MIDPRRILLLTGTEPAPNGVGGIILHDLAGFLPAEALSVLYLANGGKRGDALTERGNSMRVEPISLQTHPRSRWGKAGRAVDYLRMYLTNRRALSASLRACVGYARQREIDEVWAVLDTPATIRMAAPLAEALGVPLRVTVWDDVEHNIGYFRLDRFSAKGLRKSFAAAIRHACSLAVIGETMRDEYVRRYGKRGLIVRHGAEQPLAHERGQQPDGLLRIGFAGSVTARSAFRMLLAALDRLGWEIGGREVALVLMGQRFDLWSQAPRRIECLGWRSTVRETIEILSHCDVNYLPQPFEADWRPFSELSFPSKLTTYLAAGSPILLHSPRHASLPAFFARYPFGAWCSDLDVDALASSLFALGTNDELRSRARSAARQALFDEFTVAKFRAQFAEFMGVGQSHVQATETTACVESPAS